MHSLEGDLGDRAGELALFLGDDVDVLGPDDHVHRLVGSKPPVQTGKFLSVHPNHTVGVHDAVDDIGLPDEVGHKGVLGLVINVDGGADLLDVSLIHDDDRVGHGEGLLLIVGDVDEGDAHLLLNLFQLDLHVLAQLQIQGAQRLVK